MARATPVDDETALIAQLRAGDEAAFEQVVRQYGGRLLAVARRIVGTEEDARDVVQDAFLNAFRRDRKSTRLNSSHSQISYAVFCLKKKKRHRDREKDATLVILQRPRRQSPLG